MKFFKLRATPSFAWRIGAGVATVLLILFAWWVLTRGEDAETRIVSPVILPSLGEMLAKVSPLWFEHELSRNLAASVARLSAGFALAVAVGVPLGLVAGAWPRLHAFLMPISIFGRNIPISALVPLTLLWFRSGNQQQIMFIAIACIMFVFHDSARAVASVHESYVQTALTLGATRSQTFFKVLVPLAMPDVYASLRLLYGLAFGYIILAELIDTHYGAGHLIATAQRRGNNEYVYLILFAITATAFLIDRLLLMIQRWLFPHKEAV